MLPRSVDIRAFSKPAPNPRMGLVPTKNTEPERQLRKRLWAAGIRYRLHARSLPGSPDVVIPRSKLAVFVNGCFWHRHRGCARASTPKTNAAFWKEKFDRNCARDVDNYRKLRADGWLVMVIWECEIRLDPEVSAGRIVQLHGSVMHGGKRARAVKAVSLSRV
jgi:DNA mismatch endonuclease, patch repair protein